MFEEEGVIQHAYLKNSGRGISRFKGCEVRECKYVYASSTVIRGSRGKVGGERVTADGIQGNWVSTP